MFKWGTTQLKVKVGSYEAPFPVLNIQELAILPSGVDTPASVVQTGGRVRKRAKMRIVTDTHAEYASLYSDHMLSTVKMLELKDGVTLNSAMISNIGVPSYLDLWIECDIEFVEV